MINFKNAYQDQYRDMKIKHKRLFSLVKEGDVEGIRQENISIEDLKIGNSYKKNDL